MQSILLKGFESLNLSLKDPEERLILSGVSWQEYEKLLAHFGDSARYRISYKEGKLASLGISIPPEKAYPLSCPFSLEQILDEDFYG